MNKSEMELLEEYSDIYLKSEVSQGFEKKMRIALSEYSLRNLSGDVLEIGCGDTEWTRKILKKVSKCDVVEASKTLIENLKDEFSSEVTAHHELFENYKTNKKYDYIVASSILHHVEDPLNFLECAKRLLKDNGEILILVPNANSYHRLLGKSMGLIDDLQAISKSGHIHGHRRVFNSNDMRALLKKLDFKVNEFRTLLFKFLPNSDLDNLSQEQTNALLELSINEPNDCGAVIFCSVSLKN